MQDSNLPSPIGDALHSSYIPKYAKTDYPHGLSALGST